MDNQVPAPTEYSELIGRTIDNTALGMYKRCPRMYQYAMVQHRRRRGLTPALAYGQAWHTALETHYSVPEIPLVELDDRVCDAVLNKWEPASNTDDYRTLERLLTEYDKYLKKYGPGWEEEAKTVGWPDSPLVEIAIELNIPGARHPYCGKLDRIIEVHGQYLIEDHKTASQLRNDYFAQWEMSDQMMGYAALASIITGKPISGVRINLHVIRKSDSVFERRTIPFAQPRLDQWMRNYDLWLGRLETDLTLHQIGAPGAFPENYSACAGKYGMCTYASVCSLPERLRQGALRQDFEEEPWNPLEAKDEAGAE